MATTDNMLRSNAGAYSSSGVEAKSPAGGPPPTGWLDALLLLTLATTVASGVQYVHEWGGRARRLPGAGA